MGYFIQQSLVYLIQLELRNQQNGVFYSTVPRTKDIKSMVYFIQQSLELRISNQWFILFNNH